jgi:Uma2 family endonuclease
MSVTTPSWPLFQQPPFPVRRFTVDEYHRMIQAGLLTEDDPVELLEGWLVPKMVRNPAHDTALELAVEMIRPCVPSGWRLRVQSAVTLSHSEPEPDVAVVYGPLRSHANRHPGPGDTGLLVEVADSSLDRDRNEKGRVYAAAGIPVYWIINLVDRQVEVYTAPSGPVAAPAFGQRQDFRPGDLVPLVTGGQQVGQVAVQDLLP